MENFGLNVIKIQYLKNQIKLCHSKRFRIMLLQKN